MSIRSRQFPSLDDIAFEGRNKSYGSYFLRKMYYHYLSVAWLLGVLFLFLLVMIPFALYYLDGSGLTDSAESMYIVDYAFMPPPGDDMNELARMAARQEPAEMQVPVVVDSMPPKVEVKKEEVKTEEDKKEAEAAHDSSEEGTGATEKGAGSGEDKGIYTTIDVFPRFPGGDQARIYFLRTHIHYPEIALRAGVQGAIMTIFVVETDGSISNIEVIKGLNKYCDDEAVRVIKKHATLGSRKTQRTACPGYGQDADSF